MFSRIGNYPAVGLFSLNHIFSMIFCFSVVIFAVVLTKKMNKKQFFKLLKISAIILTILECFKIIWSLVNGYTGINSWFPLYFCSLFIYSLWFACSKNQKISSFGLSYIAFASVIAGAVFIVFPTSSFNNYPIFHFQCLYSMTFHSLMIYCGIMLYITKAVTADKKLLKKYWLFCLVFMSLAIAINLTFNANLMFLSNSAKIPLAFLKTLHSFSSVIYTIIIALAHLSIGPIVLGVYSILGKLFKTNTQTNEIEELEHKFN